VRGAVRARSRTPGRKCGDAGELESTGQREHARSGQADEAVEVGDERRWNAERARDLRVHAITVHEPWRRLTERSDRLRIAGGERAGIWLLARRGKLRQATTADRTSGEPGAARARRQHTHIFIWGARTTRGRVSLVASVLLATEGAEALLSGRRRRRIGAEQDVRNDERGDVVYVRRHAIFEPRTVARRTTAVDLGLDG